MAYLRVIGHLDGLLKRNEKTYAIQTASREVQRVTERREGRGENFDARKEKSRWGCAIIRGLSGAHSESYQISASLMFGKLAVSLASKEVSWPFLQRHLYHSLKAILCS